MIDVKKLYFSGSHFTRDLIGNIAPITGMFMLLLMFYDPFRKTLISVFQAYLASISFWAFVLVVVLWAVCAYFIGAIANIVGNLIHRMWQKLPFAKQCSYTYWYKKDDDDINALYQRIFPDYQLLSSQAAVSPTDKVNVLKEYFRRINPIGFIETYRQFLKVDIIRSVLCYATGLIIYVLLQAFKGDSIPYRLLSVCLVLDIVCLTELPRRVRKVVRSEYQFIVASGRLKQDIDLEKANAR